MTNDVQVK